MITGYNTDVRHDDIVFHVQTEDKGADNPFIESLVYVGGQVLAAKRVSYQQLLDQGSEERAIVEMMERQHRVVIAAIRQGKLDGKLRSVMGESQASTTGNIELPEPAAVPAADPGDATGTGTGTGSNGTVAGFERTLDQVILEYLTSEADQEQLVLTVDGDHRLGLGRAAELALRTTSSKSGQPVAGSRVEVRMISTVDDPRVLADGETGDAGTLDLAFDIPALDRGTAALIITAAGPLGRAEIKHLL